MDTQFNLDAEITVVPRWWRTKPIITYGVDSQTIDTVELTDTFVIKVNQDLTNGSHIFWIEFNNKDYNDCVLEKNLDMAVQIHEVKFENLSLDRFKWAGNYCPKYPKDYPDKKPVIEAATYLGWNGRWELPFTTPVFTWIHRTENLGWLYEP